MEARYLFIASMDVDPDHEQLFNEVYDEEHIPAILKVPGVVSAARFRTKVTQLLLGGEPRRIPVAEEPGYHALFELSRPDVLVSEQWTRAIEGGRWPSSVRPHTRNRRHVLLEKRESGAEANSE